MFNYFLNLTLGEFVIFSMILDPHGSHYPSLLLGYLRTVQESSGSHYPSLLPGYLRTVQESSGSHYPSSLPGY